MKDTGNRRARQGVATLGVGMVLVVTACAGSSGSSDELQAPGPTSSSACTPPAGGRCPGPEPVLSAANSLTLSADGLTISGRFNCGGTLRDDETASQVTITYVASAMPAGTMACALVPLTVTLQSPLGQRDVVDGVTGDRLHVTPAKG